MSPAWKKRKCLASVLVGMALLLWLPATAAAAEAYYLLMFGAQRVPSNPNYSHTFATFVKATWPAPGGPVFPRVEAATISWLPRNMVVRLLALQPECGQNFDLHATLRWCRNNEMRVSLWGAYQIHPELYHCALRQVRALHSGQVGYKTNDAFYRNDEVSNCIHAVSALAEGKQFHVLSPGWGEPASFFVLQELAPWVMGSCPHAWVGSALGLGNYPIIYRDWQRPRSGAFFGPVYRVLGGERGLTPSYGAPR